MPHKFDPKVKNVNFGKIIEGGNKPVHPLIPRPLDFSDVGEKLSIELGDPDLCLIVTGSIAENLATPRSDLDLILVSDTTSPPTKSGGFFLKSIEGRKSEILFFNTAGFEGAIRNLPINSTNFSHINYVHRLTRGVPIRNSAVFEQLVSKFDREHFLRHVKEVLMASTRDVFEDYLGVLSQDDQALTAIFCRRILWTCMDALLVWKGDTYIREKWRLPRMRRLLADSPDLVDTFVRLELTVPTLSVSEFERWRRQVFSCCRRIMMEAFFGIESEASEPALVGKEFYSGAEDVMLSISGNRYLLRSRTGDFEVDTFTALIFATLWRPLSLDVLSDIVASRTKKAPDRERLEERLAFLLHKKLIETKPHSR